jgi:hypothetical protein
MTATLLIVLRIGSSRWLGHALAGWTHPAGAMPALTDSEHDPRAERRAGRSGQRQ